MFKSVVHIAPLHYKKSKQFLYDARNVMLQEATFHDIQKQDVTESLNLI